MLSLPLHGPIPASPSSRRAWIEITPIYCGFHGFPVALLAEGVDRNQVSQSMITHYHTSPSSRRAWIEIRWRSDLPPIRAGSPSSRRAWIEMLLGFCFKFC